MAKRNVASSGFTAVQVGKVVRGEKPAKPAKSEPAKAPKDAGKDTEVVNVVSGNARVGRQEKTIKGGLTIRM